MPRIDDALQAVKFKKKSYRPWGEDLLDTSPKLTDESKTKATQVKKIDNAPPEVENKEKIVHLDAKKDNKIETNSGQLDDDIVVNGVQQDDKWVTLHAVAENEAAISPIDNVTNPKQLDNQNSNKKITSLSASVMDFDALVDEVKMLVGHQKKILFFIVDDCSSAGDLTTGQIPNETLRTLLNTDTNTVKTSIHRLVSKGLVSRKGGKKGRGGFTRYVITDVVKNTVLQEKQRILISKQLGNTLDNMRIANEVTQVSSSSSNNNIFKTTTTSEAPIPDDWKMVDIEPLREINFTITHLKQLISQGKLSSEQVQTSIDSFAFDLKENAKAKKITQDPVSFFMGILRKGYPYVPPSNYESPEDKAMRTYVDRQKDIERVRLEREKRAAEFSFLDWEASLPSEERLKIGGMFKGEEAQKACLMDYFIKNIWPTKKSEILMINGLNSLIES